jgi:hypothetical protein
MKTATIRSSAVLGALCLMAGAAVAQVAPSPAPSVAPPAESPAAPAAASTATPAGVDAVAATAAEPGVNAAAGGDTKASTAPVCRTVKATGSRVRTERVCTTPASAKGSQEWLRDQQHRGSSEGRNGVNGGGG